MSMAEHTRITAAKVDSCSTGLMQLMPNLGGPCSSKRRILSSVAHSITLYGAPVCRDAMKRAKIGHSYTECISDNFS
ncbi:unnamed protein product [Callosobruchus maculatus]|uniref:Uncharacterized protein n=1 Tax=Callosobruchus maculatus TaxID=64391 RepID=A0A653BX46_CALMS|nr:unnamed protein product [Callosobruchus maculatus]